jgi:hypothetical protein
MNIYYWIFTFVGAYLLPEYMKNNSTATSNYTDVNHTTTATNIYESLEIQFLKLAMVEETNEDTNNYYKYVIYDIGML